MQTSSDILISTKLKIPDPRRGYVVRRSLFSKLALCKDMSVIFICGGAGTGKTTLVSSFVKETGLKNVGWVSLDASNSNVYSFWHYFAAAAGSFMNDSDDFLELFKSNYDAAHMENLLTLFVNRLCGDENYYIVLDDVHLIKDKALIKTLEFFIDAMPDNFHLFMLSREEPPVYLGPLAVSGRLLFIDGEQMRLSPEEGTAFLKQTLKFSGTDEEISNLNSYAEGWIGGLQLAAAAQTAGKNSGMLLRAGGGIAAEYLTREIFESLQKPEQDFLLKTGYLSYFNPLICENIFDGFSLKNFDDMIEELTEKNLFIVCLDEQNKIYRYHNILSEYLTQQFSDLPESRKKELILKSAGAFEKLGDPIEALHEYCMSDDWENVMRVALEMSGNIESWTYLDRVPADILIKDADLSAQCFMYNIGNLNVERCQLLFEKFKENYEGTDVFRVIQFAEVYVSKDIRKIPEYPLLFSAKQIDGLPFGHVAKSMIFVENAAALTEHMNYKEAELCIDKAIKTSGSGNNFVNVFALGQKAQLLEKVGRLNESLECYKKIIGLFETLSTMSAIGINFYIGMTGVYMRRMELDKAEKALRHSHEIWKQQHNRITVIDMTIAFHMAEMNFLKGNDDAGAAFVEKVFSEYPSFSILGFGRLVHELCRFAPSRACRLFYIKTCGDEGFKASAFYAPFKCPPSI